MHNASGEQVPYALIEDPVLYPDNIKTERQELKWFPISEKVLVNSHQLQLALAGSGRQLNIQKSATSTSKKKLYLVDARENRHTLQTLLIDLQGEQGPFIHVGVQS